jgi:hypothetical protein
LSSTKAKYVAMTEVTKELLWLKMVVESALKVKIDIPLEIFEDNQSPICLANNKSNHSAFKKKHMNLCFHFIQAKIIAKNISLTFKRTHHMLADFLTKSAGRSSIFNSFKTLQAKMPPAS